MIVPVGGLASGLGNAAGNLASGSPEALSGAVPSGTSGGGLGQTSGTSGIEGAGGIEGTGGVEGAGGGSSFGSELTNAISSLEGSQQSAASASQALATGSVSDPEAAVTTVEDASLEMQLAAQIRTKATEAAQAIFQTQV
jgi:flagellar hook-basal body complex protein FliE